MELLRICDLFYDICIWNLSEFVRYRISSKAVLIHDWITLFGVAKADDDVYGNAK